MHYQAIRVFLHATLEKCIVRLATAVHHDRLVTLLAAADEELKKPKVLNAVEA